MTTVQSSKINTLKRNWRFATLWLSRELTGKTLSSENQPAGSLSRDFKSRRCRGF
jgi:hypothetical protein